MRTEGKTPHFGMLETGGQPAKKVNENVFGGRKASKVQEAVVCEMETASPNATLPSEPQP